MTQVTLSFKASDLLSHSTQVKSVAPFVVPPDLSKNHKDFVVTHESEFTFGAIHWHPSLQQHSNVNQDKF
jgi:hypothetical protein